jgi:membrane protease YdiL (CAAX protease family)
MPFLLKVSPIILAESLILDFHKAPAIDTWISIAGASLFVLGLTCDAYLFTRLANAWRGGSPDGPVLKIGPKLWGMDDLLMGAAYCVGLILLANSFYGVVALLTHRTLEELTPLIIFTELLVRIGILVGFVFFFHRRRVDIDAAVGLRNLAPQHAIAWGTVFGLASLPPVGIIIAASDALCRMLGWHQSEQPIIDLFTTTDSPLLLALLVVFAVIVAPIFEEFIFRGFAYPALKQRFGTCPALALVSIVFAFSHVNVPSIVPLFVLAIGLGLAYEWTGSLLAPITMHALFNAIMVARLMLLRTQL